MTKYPALAIAVFVAAISIEANATGVKPPAQPINPGVVLNQPVTLKPTLTLSNHNPSNSHSTSSASNRTNVDSTALVFSSVYVESDKRRIPVATATAPALTASNGACMGSSSAGAQGAAFGLSFGSTWTDTDCDRRYDSIRLQELGMTEAAMILMCNKPEVREAMELAGTACPDLKQKPQEEKPEAVTWN
jgi:hypothetical protein